MHHLPSRYIPCDGRLTAYAYFKSTLPAGGATVRPLRQAACTRFQSTLPAWGATENANRFRQSNSISIHTPRRGSDLVNAPKTFSQTKFQSTLPVGGATHFDRAARTVVRFQSTLPVGGSDGISVGSWYLIGDFNPRSPWGERR